MLYKIDTTTIRYQTVYVEADNIDECIYKVRKYLESKNVEFRADLILRIQLLKTHLVK